MGSMETATTLKFRKSRQIVGKPAKAMSTPCHKCGGAGGWAGWPGFTCFRCGGNGIDPTYREWGYPADWTDEQCTEHADKIEQRNQRAAERREAKRQAEAKATFEDNATHCPELVAYAADLDTPGYEYPSFMGDIFGTSHRRFLSERQMEAFAKAYAKTHEIRTERAAQPEAAKWVVEGKRQTVEGVVRTRKMKESQFGCTMKIRLVTDDGRGLWITEPSSIITELGDRVRLDCAVQISEDDPTFAFGLRPTKAEVVES